MTPPTKRNSFVTRLETSVQTCFRVLKNSAGHTEERMIREKRASLAIFIVKNVCFSLFHQTSPRLALKSIADTLHRSFVHCMLRDVITGGRAKCRDNFRYQARQSCFAGAAQTDDHPARRVDTLQVSQSLKFQLASNSNAVRTPRAEDSWLMP
jgi:hypothetical protein